MYFIAVYKTYSNNNCLQQNSTGEKFSVFSVTANQTFYLVKVPGLRCTLYCHAFMHFGNFNIEIQGYKTSFFK